MELSNGSVAVVTGAASGIGAALGTAFAAAGCSVVLADVDAVALDAVAATIEGEVLTVVTDVSVAADLEHLAEAAFDRFGAVHVLCNNAGVSTFNPVVAQTLDDWRWVLGVNLWGVDPRGAGLPPEAAGPGATGPHREHVVAGRSGERPALARPLQRQQGGRRRPQRDAAHGAGHGRLARRRQRAVPGQHPHPDPRERAQPAGGARPRTAACPMATLMREAVRSGFDGPGARTAAEVAGDVLDGVRSDRFWIITSGEMRELVSSRFHEIDGSTPQG